ncbi:hypothetical protein SDC9_172098 [bioreactor metagenome]|uniref:Uncharacterized protein n=1 Tax=bioreactor metagenome TaxID=1076179 RepID=A0A645GEX5_9ZZZZ
MGGHINFGALALLCPVVDQCDTGGFAAHGFFHIHTAHGGKAVQHVGGAFHIGTAVQQQPRFFFAGDDGADGRTLDAVQPLDNQGGTGKQCTG